jgi:hypothetical protein
LDQRTLHPVIRVANPVVSTKIVSSLFFKTAPLAMKELGRAVLYTKVTPQALLAGEGVTTLIALLDHPTANKKQNKQTKPSVKPTSLTLLPNSAT